MNAKTFGLLTATRDGRSFAQSRQSSDMGGTVSLAKGAIAPAIRDWIEKNQPV